MQPLFLALVLAVVIAMSSRVVAGDRPCHLFLFSGQSNIVRLKPDHDFVPEAQRLLPGAEVVYVKVAYGGQPIRRWVTEWDQIAQRHGVDVAAARGKDKSHEADYYQELLAKSKAALAEHESETVTFCWMQGSADAKAGLSDAYEESLAQLIANLRRDLGRPDMQVVVGRMSDFKPGNERWKTIRQAQLDVVGNDPHGAWVDTDDCNDYEEDGKVINDMHLTPDGFRVCGHRFARQAVAMIEGRPPADNGRPGDDLICTPTPRVKAAAQEP